MAGSTGGLTPRGWYLAGAAAVLALLAFLVGLEELYALAAACLALLTAAGTWLRHQRAHLAAFTEARPGLVGVGGEALAWLTLTNLGDRRLPIVTVHLPLDAMDEVGVPGQPSVLTGATTSFCLWGMAPGKGNVTSYRLPTGRRGAWAVGPVTATLSDPLGLTARTFYGGTPARVVVHPRVWPLAPLPRTTSGNSSGPLRSLLPAVHGDELRAVREYEPGDDLRRVHWRATARWDRLMVRQDEASDDCLVWVDVDLRAATHTPASLERCLEAAASIAAVALAAPSTQVRLTTTMADALGPVSGVMARTLVLEHLALAAAHDGTAAPVLPGNRADIAVLVSATETAAKDLLSRGRATSRALLLVVAAAETPPPGEPLASRRLFGQGPGALSLVRAGGDLPAAWAAAMRPYL